MSIQNSREVPLDFALVWEATMRISKTMSSLQDRRALGCGSLTLIVASVSLLWALAGCGGGGGSSSSTPMNQMPAPMGPSYAFTPDSGVRVTGGGTPVEIVLDQTIYMVVGDHEGGGGDVLSSTDGLNFATVSAATLDGGPLIGPVSSFVKLPNGKFRMYLFTGPSGTPVDALLSAISSDGLTWTSEAGTRIVLNDIATPKVLALIGGGYRVYYTTSGGPTGIASATSSDGLTFTEDAGLRLSPTKNYNWGDPNVFVTGSTYLMSVTQWPSQPGYSSIWLASSPDGLAWTTDATAAITNATGSPVDSSTVALSNGAFRIYYGVFIGATTPKTNAPSDILSGVLAPTGS